MPFQVHTTCARYEADEFRARGRELNERLGSYRQAAARASSFSNEDLATFAWSVATATWRPTTTGRGRTEDGGGSIRDDENGDDADYRGEWTSALVGELHARGPGKTRAEMQPKDLAKILWSCASASADADAASWAGGDASSEAPPAVEVEIEDSILVNAVRATVRNKEYTASDAVAVLWCAVKLKKAKKGRDVSHRTTVMPRLAASFFHLSLPMSDHYAPRA